MTMLMDESWEALKQILKETEPEKWTLKHAQTPIIVYVPKFCDEISLNNVWNDFRSRHVGVEITQAMSL